MAPERLKTIAFVYKELMFSAKVKHVLQITNQYNFGIALLYIFEGCV